MKRPIFLTSFFSMKFSGSKLRTSAAIWQANAEVSKAVMRPTPLLPAVRACQPSAVVLPTEQSRPMPVMTTRRLRAFSGVLARLLARVLSKLLACLGVLADVVDGVVDGANLLGVFVGDLDVEGLFEGHDEFYGVERVGAEVVYERCAGRDFALVHTQLLYDDLLHFFVYCCHVFLASESGVARLHAGRRLLIATAEIYDCVLLIAVYEVETSSLKGIGKVCKGGCGEITTKY